MISRTRLYSLAVTLVMAGYIWFTYNLVKPASVAHDSFTVCMLKNITGIPCPSCGSTRSAMELLKGNIRSSLYYNPFGIILLATMVFLPLWLFYDITQNKKTFYLFYQKAEIFARKRNHAIVLALIVAANWGWNIYKNL